MPVVPEWKPRDLAAEKKLVQTIEKLIPKVHTVPAIAEDARQCLNDFVGMLGVPDHPHPDHVRRLPELTKIDILHRCIYSGSPEITLEMVERSILWGKHQLALRLAFWPEDARNETVAMTKILLNRLGKGTATARDLRTAAHVQRDGTHELFNRCLSALTRSGEIKVLTKNRKNFDVFGLVTE
jgi:hypothetical protein